MSEINSTESLIKHIKSLKNDNDLNDFKIFEAIKQVAIKNNVWARYEKDRETGRISRVLLSIYKYRPKNKNFNSTETLLHYQSNALVIDAENWDVVAHGPLNFNKKLNIPKIDQFLKEKKYEITKINDGTTITLYPWKTRWAIASSNAYDISNMVWVGDKSYIQIFKDLVDRLYPEFINETGMEILGTEGNLFLNFTKLDRTKSYTIVFRHHDFHPIKEDPEKIWQIQVIDLSNPYNAVPITEENKLPCFHLQEYVDKTKINSVSELYELTKDSVSDAISGSKPSSGSYAAAAAGSDEPVVKKFNYGYILTSIDRATTKENSSIIIQSEFLKKIRSIHYMGWNSEKIKVNKKNINDVKIMRALIGSSEIKELFVSIHPESVPKMKEFEEFLDVVVDLTFDKLKNDTTTEKENTYVEKFCCELVKHIKENSALKPTTSISRDIVKDWCYETKYAPIYTKIFFEEFTLGKK